MMIANLIFAVVERQRFSPVFYVFFSAKDGVIRDAMVEAVAAESVKSEACLHVGRLVRETRTRAFKSVASLIAFN